MFGGLQDFLKLRRGLQQDTQDREFLAKQRDLTLRTGETSLQGADLNNQLLGKRLGRFDIDAAQGDLRFTNELGGPKALREVLTADPSQMLGSRVTAKSMLPGVMESVRRQELGTESAELGVKGQRQGVDAAGIRLKALQNVASGQAGDPTKSQEALTTYGIAGVQAGPTFEQQQKALEAQQSRTLAHAAQMQQRAQNFQVEMANRSLPPGVAPAADAMAMTSIEQFAKRTASAYQQIAMLQREMTESSAQKRSLEMQNLPGRNSAAINGFQAIIDKNKTDIEALQNQIQNQANQVKATIGQFAPKQVQYYGNLVDSWTMGATPTPSATPDPKVKVTPGTPTKPVM